MGADVSKYPKYVLDRLEYGHLAGINYESAVDGPGVRTAIFFSGCAHHCPGCHNPETWNEKFGVRITERLIDKIAKEINRRPCLAGITLTGGDPLYNAGHTLNFVVSLKQHLGYLPNIWLYTGFTMEEFETNLLEPSAIRLLSLCDTIVDGPFVKELADKRLAFRGSSNQRIIPVSEILFA